MSAWLLAKAIPLILKVLVGPLTFFAARAILNLKAWIDRLPPFAKRIVVAIVALGISFAAHATGTTLPVECAGVSAGDLTDACVSVLSSKGFLSVSLTGALGAGIAFLLHAAKKSDPRK